MQFAHTWEKVLSQDKTQTRRLALPEPDSTGNCPCEMIRYPDGNEAVCRYSNGAWRIRWQVKRPYAVQPGRNKKAVGYISIKEFKREDVRTISNADVKAEGFHSFADFIKVWCKMHDPDNLWRWYSGVTQDSWKMFTATVDPATYQAWALKFALIQGLMRNA